MTLAYPMSDPRTARPATALTQAFERHGGRQAFARDEEIYAQDQEAELLYRVVRGVVRTSRLTVDGRRQVGDFYYPGDLFGLEPGPDQTRARHQHRETTHPSARHYPSPACEPSARLQGHTLTQRAELTLGTLCSSIGSDESRRCADSPGVRTVPQFATRRCRCQ